MAPMNTERKMPAMVMMPHVVMPVSAARVMPAVVPSAFDLDNRLVEMVRIPLRYAAYERKRRCGRSEQHRAGRERQKSDLSHDVLQRVCDCLSSRRPVLELIAEGMNGSKTNCCNSIQVPHSPARFLDES